MKLNIKGRVARKVFGVPAVSLNAEIMVTAAYQLSFNLLNDSAGGKSSV
ncbi:MAG TPA: hypothetical protein VEA59_02885 [Patescibacteria group bacterium]|nr:hypothetical protein [Patescibacteria group bacterium]